jgi:hypothetical protein
MGMVGAVGEGSSSMSMWVEMCMVGEAGTEEEDEEGNE